METKIELDAFGKAVKDYFKNKWRASAIKVESNISSKEKISPAYLFRKFNKMPEIEQEALKQCKGKVLDVGACAGSHSLYLQKENIEVTAVDISTGCCEVMKLRGVKNVECCDFFEFDNSGQSFDTVLLLMNGIGIAGTLVGLRNLLQKTRSLLADNGKVIFDSSDIDYAFYEDDGSKWVDLNSDYYGEVCYTLSYKEEKGTEFNWLFIDPDTMKQIAKECGFSFKILKNGSHYDYLAELRIISD